MGLLELWLITAPLWAILCALIAQSKGLNVGGWVLWGILLGVIGVVMVSVAPNRTQGSSRSSYSGSRVPDTDPFSTSPRGAARKRKSADNPAEGIYGPDERDADLLSD